ncbi:MAG: ABC transporter permease [Clostridia bacterium]|nr:ABC transporter permease [Clostridia bacterium]
MEFIKTLIKNRKLVLQLGKNDFKNKFASTSLGAVWGFIQPFVFMFTYVIVFQFILKTESSGDYPFIVWYLPGLAMWQIINDSVINGSNSIRNYSYLVKKVVFPVDIIPIISLTSSFIVGIFLLVIATSVSVIFGYLPNVLLLVYMIFAALCFIISLVRFTSAVTTLVPDFSNLVSVVMQLMFWFTPIMWNVSQLAEYDILAKIVKSMPFSYLVTGFRQVFIAEDIITKDNYIYTIIFWLVTVLIYIWGNSVFKRNKKDFADVL